MYYINKIVGWVLSPLGVAFLGAAFSWTLWRLRWRKTSRALAWTLAISLWFLSTGLGVRLIGVPLEYGAEYSGFMPKFCGDIRGLPKADAICVLGGGVGVHHQCRSPELYSAGDRVRQGARLYKAGLAPKVICTSKYTNISTAPLLEEMGVDPKAIVCLEEPRNTEEEAATIKSYGVKRILLVTSAWHMKRAKARFVNQGFEVVEAPTDYEMSAVAENPFEFADLLPNADALLLNSYAIKEWIGRFGYWVIDALR